MEFLSQTLRSKKSYNNNHDCLNTGRRVFSVEPGKGLPSSVVIAGEDPLPGTNSKKLIIQSEETEKDFFQKQLRKIIKDKRTWIRKKKEEGGYYVEENPDIFDYDIEENKNRLVQKLLDKKSFDEDGYWRDAVCRGCEHVVKEKAIKLHSFSRYSSESSNVQALISLNKKKLKTLLRNLRRVKEFVISFKTHPAYFKTMKNYYSNIINLLFEELREVNIDFPCLQVIDFKITLDEDTKLWQVHFHFIAPNLEQKKFDVRVWHKARKKIIEKTGEHFTISFGKYKKKRKIIGYFALMMSGRYTFEERHHGAGLDEIIDPVEYLVNFWGMRSYTIRGHKKDKDGNKIKNPLINFNASYFEWLCSISCSAIPEICPFCGCTDIKLVREDPSMLYDPPPAYKTCPECGMNAIFSDWNEKTNTCKLCGLRKGFDYRKSIELKYRLPEVARSRREDYELEKNTLILDNVLQNVSERKQLKNIAKGKC